MTRRTTQLIRTPRGEELIVLPRAEYERLCEADEDLADIRAARAAHSRMAKGEDEPVPFVVAERLIAGENPIRVWREQRGMQISELAAAAGISSAYLSQIEGGKRRGTVAVMAAIAKALGISLDDLIP